MSEQITGAQVWYFHRGNGNEGPFTAEDLLKMYYLGQISDHHLVWCAGMPRWMCLKDTGLVRSSETNATPLHGSWTTTHEYNGTQLIEPKLTKIPLDSFGGFWARAVASLVDHFILMMINTLVAIPLVLFVPNGVHTHVLSSAFNILLTFYYFAALQSKWKGTPGKRVLGLMLVGEDGQALSAAACLRRHIFLSIAMLPLGAGVLAIGLNRRKQGWHDRWCKSFVIKRTAYELLMSTEKSKDDTKGEEPPSTVNLAA